MTFGFVLEAVSAPALERGPEALQRPSFLRDASAWTQALAQAELLHSALPFADAVARAPWRDEIPAGAREAIEARRARERMLLALLDHELELSLGALSRARIPVLLVKGMDLGRRFYPDRACRPMTDADILVPEGSYTHAMEALASEGFRAVGSLEPKRVRVELSRGPQCPVVELHRRLLADSTPAETAALWERSCLQRFADLEHPVRVLSAEDSIEYLVRHGAIQHLAETPVWLNDLFFLLRGSQPPVGWERIISALKAKRARSGAWFALSLIASWGVDVPRAVLDALGRPLGPLRRSILAAEARPEIWFSPEPRSLAWVIRSRFLLRESAWEALKYGVTRQLGALRTR